MAGNEHEGCGAGADRRHCKRMLHAALMPSLEGGRVHYPTGKILRNMGSCTTIPPNFEGIHSKMWGW